MMRKLAAIVMSALLTAACSGGDAEPGPSSTVPVTTAAPSTTTTLPSPNPAALPAFASVERLAWEGSVLLSADTGEGISRIEADVEGAFVAPGLHRVTVSSETTGVDGSVESDQWTATIVERTGWVLQGDDLSAFDAETVAEEFMTVLSTATGTVIPSSIVLGELAGIEEVETATRDGRSVAIFSIPDASIGLYSTLFASDFGLAFGAQTLSADVELTVDVATGAVLEGALVAAGSGLQLEIRYRVTAIDDPATVIETAEITVPGTLVPYDDEGGRFSLMVPEGWNVDIFDGAVVFRPPYSASEVIVSVLVDGSAATAGEMADRLLADSPPGLTIVERAPAEVDGADAERLVVEFETVAGATRAVVWATAVDGVGYGLEIVVEADLFESFAPFGDELVAGFRPGG